MSWLAALSDVIVNVNVPFSATLMSFTLRLAVSSLVIVPLPDSVLPPPLNVTARPPAASALSSRFSVSFSSTLLSVVVLTETGKAVVEPAANNVTFPEAMAV